MLLSSGQHLTYCTNIHPGKDWATTFQALKENVPAIKQQVYPHREFGIGLRLSNLASTGLLNDGELAIFKDWLKKENLYVFTLNGFPYGEFHGTRVKDRVHHPDWTTPERLQYTIRLFDILDALIPEGVEGGISTSPISYRHWFNQEELEAVFNKACQNLTKVVVHLKGIEDRTGKYLHLDIEPEPDGLLQNNQDVLDFYENYAYPIIGSQLEAELGIGSDEAKKLINRYLNLCYDACHYALAFEDPVLSFRTLKEAGIRIGKVQLSSALLARFTGKSNEAVWQSLEKFREPVYLHQVTALEENQVVVYPDLDPVLDKKPAHKELRAHFHVPLFLENFGALQTAQEHLVMVIDQLVGQGLTNHLEIETYTWDVFPESMKNSLTDTVVQEFNWVMRNLGYDE